MNTIRASVAGVFLMRRIACDQKLFSGIRSLYTQQFLNLDKYVEGRELTQKQYGNMKGNFMNRMKQQVEGTTASMIFTDDLKSIVHLCEGTQEDLDLCTKMIRRFHHQNKELRFGTFVFGPVVMRMLYHLKQTDLALQLVKDQEIDGFFDQIKSFFLLMDLLFKEGRYEDILELNEILKKKRLSDTKFPRDCFVLTCAACYKLNTPESFKLAIDLIREARTDGADIIPRALHFLITLALNQNQPETAMELLSSLPAKNNTVVNNLKIVTLAHLNRVRDALIILRRKVEEDYPSPSTLRGDICQTSLDILQQKVEELNDTETSHLFDQLSRSLKEASFVSNQSVDDLLMTPVFPRPIMERRPNYGDFGPRQPPMRPREGNASFRRDRNMPSRRQALGSISSDQF